MKTRKILIFILILTIISSCLFALSGCNKQAENKPVITSLNSNIIKNFAADIGGAKSVGIKKMSTEASGASAASDDNTGLSYEQLFKLLFGNIQLLSDATACDTTTITTKNYIVTSNGNSSDLEKMTFTTATETTEDVFDDDGNLVSSTTTVTQDEIPAQVNKLYVCGDFTFIQLIPIVSKSGNLNYLDENGDMKTMYVDVRNENGKRDENGVLEFDKCDYYTDALHKSFVIDTRDSKYVVNATNDDGVVRAIYSLEGAVDANGNESFPADGVTKIENNLIRLGGAGNYNLIFDMYLDADKALHFEALVGISEMEFQWVYKDKWNNIYLEVRDTSIYNDNGKTLQESCEEHNYLSAHFKENIRIYYHTGRDYIFDDEKNMLYINSGDGEYGVVDGEKFKYSPFDDEHLYIISNPGNFGADIIYGKEFDYLTFFDIQIYNDIMYYEYSPGGFFFRSLNNIDTPCSWASISSHHYTFMKYIPEEYMVLFSEDTNEIIYFDFGGKFFFNELEFDSRTLELISVPSVLEINGAIQSIDYNTLQIKVFVDGETKLLQLSVTKDGISLEEVSSTSVVVETSISLQPLK